MAGFFGISDVLLGNMLQMLPVALSLVRPGGLWATAGRAERRGQWVEVVVLEQQVDVEGQEGEGLQHEEQLFKERLAESA